MCIKQKLNVKYSLKYFDYKMNAHNYTVYF